MSDQLRQGDFLRSVIAQANDQTVWVRGPQIAFCGWAQALDAWMRNQLVGALDAVRLKVESYVRDFDNAQQAFANGIQGVALPPPPAPMGTPPPNCPYPFLMEVPKGTNPNMNPDLMRKGLGNALGRAKEELHAFAQKLGDVLTEPAPVPSAPALPGAPPTRHLPPDAKDAAGVPNTYQAIEVELEKALHDVIDRAQAWEEAQAADDGPSLGTGLGLLPSFDDLLQRSQQEAAVAPAPAPTPEAQAPAPVEAAPAGPPPQTPEEIEKGKRAADELVDQYPPKEAVKDPRMLWDLSKKIKEHQPNPDPAFSAQVVQRFGPELLQVPRTLVAWQHRWTSSNRGGPGQTYLDYDKLGPEAPKDEEVMQVLYAFSATLATATSSDQLPPEVATELTHGEDAQSLAWLLSDPDAKFGTDFLVKAFDHVKEQVVFEAGKDLSYRLPPSSMAGLRADPKVTILEAIARNPDASAIVVNQQLDRRIDVYRSGGDDAGDRVKDIIGLLYQGQYSDKGDALGKLLDSAHGSIYSHDPAAAKELVERILRNSDNRDNVNAARDHLRAIGARQAVDPGRADAALREVQEHTNSRNRDLLLGLASQSEASANAFLEAAEKAFPKKDSGPFEKDKTFHPHKNKDVKNLFETEAAWDNVLKASASSNPDIRNRAQTVTERVMGQLGSGSHINENAARGLARVLSQDLAAIAPRLMSKTAEEAAAAGYGVSVDQMRATLKEIAKDKEALSTLISGFGASLAGPYADVADQFAKALPQRTPDMSLRDWETKVGNAGAAANGFWQDGSVQMGSMLCEIADGARQAGIQQREAALATLANFRLGVDIAIGLIPGAAQAEAALNKVVSKIPDTRVQEFEGKVKDGIAEAISGIDEQVLGKGKATAQSTREALESMINENMMAAMAKNAEVLYRLETRFPDSMLVNPGQPIPPPITDPPPPRIPPGYLKPQFMDPGGGARLPLPGSPEYPEFKKWAEQSKPPVALHNAATAAAKPVRDQVTSCMANKLWDEHS